MADAKTDAPKPPNATIAVRVQPRARKDEILTIRNGRLVVRLTAPPLDGRANQALTELIAKRVGLRASQVAVIQGERNRDKLVRIVGVGQDEAERRLAPPSAPNPRP